MVSLSVTCALFGTLLGLRVKGLVLVPATTAALALILAYAIASGAGAWWGAIIAVAAALSLQGGYLIGAALGATDVPAGQRFTTPADSRSAR
jgi:hypothetical protein